jgi:class 3 adenylate cyclase
MGLLEDLEGEVANIFREPWDDRDGKVIPAAKDLKLGNDAVNLQATVLYADMADSTGLVDGYQPKFAAEIYKTYLIACARVIKAHGGEITAYDGDRIMAVYIGDSPNTSAANTALGISYAMDQIIQPKLKAQYPNESYVPKHCVGIDTSNVLVARVGVRNDNDLVWVGRAANYAAKLCGLREGEYTSRITGEVYDKLHKNAKTASNGKSMWEERVWTSRGKLRIFRSNWWRKPD